jgi:predicted Zn finger-like uncharacterized protein
MFTVCPKCALTLVVTAADLRVAQGYVRCGRCSNVFNALARLSEDRQAAAAAAQGSGTPSSPPPPATTAPGTSEGQGPATQAAPPTPPPQSTPAPSRPGRTPPPSAPESVDEDSIPESALEFNPDATDVTKVFVEPPPNPQWTAATGTFKAIVLQSEETTDADADDRSERAAHAPATQDTDEPLDVEIDPEMIVSAAATRDTSSRRDSAPARQNPAPRESANASARDTRRRVDTAALKGDEVTVEDDETDSDEVGRFPTTAKPAAPSKPTPAPPSTRTAPSARSAPPKPTRTEQPKSSRRGASSSAVARFVPEETNGATAADERLASIGRGRATAAEFSTEPMPSESRFAALWSVGTGALVIILAAQIVNHYRNDLAASPQLNRPLTALYAALGIPLVPKWDLRAYDVRQLGASVDAASAGQIMVRASVKNSAHQAQPLPLLRVTLQDRFGNRIAARDVPPQSYLPRAIPASSYLSAGQRIDAEMAFVDPGSNAVGFEIDACLPAPAGGINCANDPGVR